MKITFEGEDLKDVLYKMAELIIGSGYWSEVVAMETYWRTGEKMAAPPPAATAAVNPRPVDKPADTPVHNAGITEPLKIRDEAHYVSLVPKIPLGKPKRERTEKQKANDEKMRVAALERIAAKRAAKAGAIPVAAPPPQPEPKIEPDPQPEPFADPAETVRLRERTIKDLQEAYANGHQQEVFELLSRFGNGAKSFRELPPEAFGPIREAIDKGALT